MERKEIFYCNLTLQKGNNKIVLNNNPNEDVNCSLLVSTDLLTYDECEKIHDKNYSFFH